MKLDRRHFIAAGLGGVTAACHRFVIDPTVPWLSVQLPGIIGLSDDDRNGGLTALLVDAKAADPMLRPHFPRLVTDESNVDMKASSKQDGTKTNPKTKLPSLLYWDLSGYHVTFPAEPDRRIVRAKTLLKRLEDDELPNLLTMGDVSWIPRMSKLTPTGKSRINPACFAQDPRPAKVAARVHFGSGELTAIFPKNDTGRYDKIVFEFQPRPPRGRYRQALGMPRLIQQLPHGTTTIKLEPFDRSMPSKTIVLGRSQEFGDPIEVEVRNESADPEDPGFLNCMNNDEVQVLDHFGALYTLLDPRDQGDIKPIPHAVDVSGEYKDSVMPKCPSSDIVIWCPGGGF